VYLSPQPTITQASAKVSEASAPSLFSLTSNNWSVALGKSIPVMVNKNQTFQQQQDPFLVKLMLLKNFNTKFIN
jgi:hypothetical protein